MTSAPERDFNLRAILESQFATARTAAAYIRQIRPQIEEARELGFTYAQIAQALRVGGINTGAENIRKTLYRAPASPRSSARPPHSRPTLQTRPTAQAAPTEPQAPPAVDGTPPPSAEAEPDLTPLPRGRELSDRFFSMLRDVDVSAKVDRALANSTKTVSKP
ncbi:MAG: hypothetical protein AB7P21_30195 [Lautropia sp.]